eukprot:1223632-Pyramimonas_sp.AAC.1
MARPIHRDKVDGANVDPIGVDLARGRHGFLFGFRRFHTQEQCKHVEVTEQVPLLRMRGEARPESFRDVVPD